MDKLGAPTGRNGGALVVARTGSQSMHKVMPDEREWISVLCCKNLDRASIQIFYVLKRNFFWQNYIEAYEARATMAMQPCTWMTSFVFAQWISHFVKFVEAMEVFHHFGNILLYLMAMCLMFVFRQCKKLVDMALTC